MKLMPLVAVGLCASLLTGCLAPRTAKLKNMAVEYVEAKYGFTAKATDVTVDGISWLEPSWNKGKSGRVKMSYDGKTFYVQVYLNEGVRDCTDTYQEEEFVEYLTDIVQDELSCERLCATMDFGVGNTLHYLGIDVLTIDDLLKRGNLDVRVSTFGLDHSKVASFDTTRLGANPKIGIYCWKDSSIVDAGYTPQNSVSLADSDTISLTDHYYFLDGAWTHHPYEQHEDETVAFAYRADLDVEIAQTTVETDEDSESASSPWYRLSTSSSEEQRVLVFPREPTSGREMCLQFYNAETGEITTSTTNIGYYGNETAPPHVSAWPYHTFVWLNLTYKDGTVDSRPQVIRISYL